MGLSDNCQEILCGIAVAGGAIAATTLGIPVATGVVELVTGGGNLALAVSREQQDRCEKLLRDVKKRVARDCDDWIKSEFRNNEAAKADLEAAFDELDRLLPVIKPTAMDIVEAGFNADRLYHRMKTKLPEKTLFHNNDNAERVLRSIIMGTYNLMRSDSSFSTTFTSLGFERVTAELGTLGIKSEKILSIVERAIIENRLLNQWTEAQAEDRHREMSKILSETMNRNGFLLPKNKDIINKEIELIKDNADLRIKLAVAEQKIEALRRMLDA